MANLKNADLYNAILTYQIDDPNVALPFEKRLARENGWTLSLSRRTIEEYKKFIYLCMTAGHPCSPSDEVDQAWHLHMLYTSSYFERLCNQILGKTISHEPTKGGHDENEKFQDWYAKTLESYQSQFGTEPPADIWPSSEERLQDSSRYQRINVQENFILPKKRIRQIAFGTAALAASLTFIGCSIDGAWRTEQVDKTLQIIAIFALVLILLNALIKYIRDNEARGGCSGGGCATSSCGSSGCGSGCGGGCGGGD